MRRGKKAKEGGKMGDRGEIFKRIFKSINFYVLNIL